MSSDPWVVVSSISGLLSAAGALAAAIYAAKSANASMLAVKEMQTAREIATAPKVERLNENEIKVPFICISRKPDGHFDIPGYGRLNIALDRYMEIEKGDSEVAFICNRVTGSRLLENVWRVGSVVPLK